MIKIIILFAIYFKDTYKSQPSNKYERNSTKCPEGAYSVHSISQLHLI